MKKLDNPKVQRALYFIIIVNIACNYIFLYDIYRPHNVDDAWFLAFAFNYFKFGEILDTTFNGGTTEGLLFFRKTGALFYGYILNKIGWDYGKAQFISALLMFGSGWFWFLALQRLNFNINERIAFLALFFLMEFSFATATSLRYESLILFFQSASLLLLLQKRYFLVGLISLIAVETHPIAVLNLAYLTGIIISHHFQNNKPGSMFRVKSNKKEIIYLSLGCIVGLAYYFYLHPISYTSLYKFLYLNSVQGVGEYYDTKLGILGLYFFTTKYFRHIPELIIFLVALYLFISNQLHKEKLFVLAWILMLIFLSFLRPIFTYAAIILPAFIVLMVSSFQAIRKLNLLLLIFVCLMVPQYMAVYYLNHNWNRSLYLSEIKSFVPNDGLPVIGSAMSWFALKDRKNFTSGIYPFHSLKQPKWQELYLIEDKFYRNKDEYRGTKDYLNKNYSSSTIKTSNQTGGPIVLKQLTLK